MNIEERVSEINQNFSNEVIEVLREHCETSADIIPAFKQISNAYTESVNELIKLTVDYALKED